MPHLHQKLSCFRSGVDYPQFMGDEPNEEILRPLLRHLNFSFECGIKPFFPINAAFSE